MNLARLCARLKPVFLSKKGPSKARLLTKMSSSEELGTLQSLTIRFKIILTLSATEQAGEEGADPAEAFRDHVVKKANIATTSTGDAIAIFREITSLSPRGRYDFHNHKTD